MSAKRLLAVSAVAQPGGAETTLFRLLRELRARGWHVTLTAPARSAPAAASGAYDEFAMVRPGGLGRGEGARALLSWPRLARLAGGADVVYLNGTVSARLLPAALRQRTVLHVHDVVARTPRFWRRADVVLAASQAVADRLDGIRAHVVWAPVDPDPPPVQPPWSAGGGPVVGFVGRIEPRKGPLDLVRAAPLIRARLADARIVLVGDDPYRSDRAYTEAVSGAEDVEHYGWVENAPGLMRSLDVLVLPSHREPVGTVLLEAMAVGTPVVATRVDGLPEVVEDGVTGILVEPGAPEALAAAVVAVLERRDEMGAAAREHARRFHTPAYADRVERLIAS